MLRGPCPIKFEGMMQLLSKKNYPVLKRTFNFEHNVEGAVGTPFFEAELQFKFKIKSTIWIYFEH
jgi:hypothetical protein